MILVAVESLIDLIVGPDHGVHASPGGGPFNAARTIARLGQPTRFLGRFSDDPFGQLLTGKLAQDGVELAIPGWVAEPTALAIGSRRPGRARVRFHVAQTAGFVLTSPRRSGRCADITAVHVGPWGLSWIDGVELERLVQRRRRMCCSCSPELRPGPSPTPTRTGPGSAPLLTDI
jgi:fructokinase